MKYLKKKDDLFKIERWRLIVYYVTIFIFLFLAILLPINKHYPVAVRIVGYFILIILASFFISKIAHVCMNGNENRIKKMVVLAIQALITSICIVSINLYNTVLLVYICLAFLALIICFVVYQIFNFYVYAKNRVGGILFCVVLIIALISIVVGLVLGFTKGLKYLIVTKIGLGMMYVLTTVWLMNWTFFNEKYFFKKELKKNLYFVAFIILLYTTLIFTFPVYISWCGLSGSGYDNFITLYSATITGIITLGGVAWGIRNTKDEKKEEERKKAKPIFTYNAIYINPDLVKTKKACFSEDPEFIYQYSLFFEIENSDRSVFTVKRVMHDGRWFGMGNNTVVLPSSKVLLSFLFDDKDGIYLEIEDCLQQCYYYKVDVLWIKKLGNFKYTICGLKEVPISQVENKAQKEK